MAISLQNHSQRVLYLAFSLHRFSIVVCAVFLCQELCTGNTPNLSGLTTMNGKPAFSHPMRNVGLNAAL